MLATYGTVLGIFQDKGLGRAMFRHGGGFHIYEQPIGKLHQGD